jgi:hypothetical protein
MKTGIVKGKKRESSQDYLFKVIAGHIIAIPTLVSI